MVGGDGTADFGVEGRAGVAVQDVYDRTVQRWVKVGYELGSQQAKGLGRAVAAR